MAIRVPYLSEEEIEEEAGLLLAEYEETCGAPSRIPVPVEEITTYHSALRLEFADLHQLFRVPMVRDQPDILGAVLVDTETVLIDHTGSEEEPIDGGPLSIQRGPRNRALAAPSVIRSEGCRPGFPV
jgi:hypothetical protein